MSDLIDPACCPLCDLPNHCNQCAVAATQQPCWCFSANIPSDIYERIPDAAKDKACLCARCAHGDSAPAH